mmetsp:Transcript_68392/g.142594  ORF Transcript_68392/g.142594 Transcript_68392/m.142594 type:complete len:95 (+) Transcript_68392:1299-1583(+)
MHSTRGIDTSTGSEAEVEAEEVEVEDESGQPLASAVVERATPLCSSPPSLRLAAAGDVWKQSRAAQKPHGVAADQQPGKRWSIKRVSMSKQQLS